MAKRERSAGSKQVQRAFLPNLGELIDRLTVDQIRLFARPRDKKSCEKEIRSLTRDIGLVIKERKVKLSAKLVKAVIVLAQANLHIWTYKDKMAEDPRRYARFLKLCHQFNGVRNQAKNVIVTESGYKGAIDKKSNVSTDGLKRTGL